MNHQLINRLLTIAVGFLAFLGSIFLLILAWYIALPFLLILLIASFLQKDRYQWVKIIRTHPFSSASSKKRKEEKIIDIEYEEIKK